ncbi:MAG: aminoglycoside phosphotransferase family protein [Actinomycetota bacterium]|nr:aminoglycoside phosphotransferase family protein [Actinomycetota bacterium]
MSDPRIPPDLPVVMEQGSRPAGKAWLPTLPGLLDAAVARWELKLGEPFCAGSAAWVAPAVRGSDGLEGVLKITMPHREAVYEGDGLRHWNGEGAVRVYEQHRGDYALFIERCHPGTALRDDPSTPEERLEVASELLARLWAQPVPEGSPFETVDDVCREWADLVRQRMATIRPDLDPGLVETGAALLETLPGSASRRVLVHGDFNPTNVLRSERETWLAIDAKPMIGDPGYDVLPLATQIDPSVATPDADHLRRTFGLVSAVVREPDARLFAWAMARMVESALWHASLAELDGARSNMAWARVLADLAGV